MSDIIEFIRLAGRSILLTLLTLWTGSVTAEYTFNRLQPESFWLEYHSTEPQSDVIPAGAPIGMQSVSIVKKPLGIEHHDILRCRPRGSEYWRFISQQIVQVRYKQPIYIGYRKLPPRSAKNAKLISGLWDYRSDEPVPPGECKIEVNIAFTPSVGVIKQLQLESGPFGIS